MKKDTHFVILHFTLFIASVYVCQSLVRNFFIATQEMDVEGQQNF